MDTEKKRSQRVSDRHDEKNGPDLYEPDIYQVQRINRESNIALCTGWSMPEKVTEALGPAERHLNLTGTLYSAAGVSPLMRNLGLNPLIDTLIIDESNPLSRNSIGQGGLQLIKELWERVKDDQPLDTGLLEKLHPEITPEGLEEIVQRVKLVVVEQFADLSPTILSNIRYLQFPHDTVEPISFSPHIQPDVETLPSEETTHTARGGSIMDTWLRALGVAYKYGRRKPTQYGGDQREIQRMVWTIEKPWDLGIDTMEPNLLDMLGINKETAKSYEDALLTPDVPEGTAYTYGQRATAYPTETNGQELDQVNAIIEMINRDNSTRRAFITIPHPPIDIHSNNPPCLVNVQVLVSNDGKLNMFATYRSHDMGKAALLNAYSLAHLQQHIATATNLEIGQLSITSESAHIYGTDLEAVDRIVKRFESKQRVGYDPERPDPRGNFNVILNDRGEYTLQHFTPAGELIDTFTTRISEKALRWIAERVTDPYHLTYLGAVVGKLSANR